MNLFRLKDGNYTNQKFNERALFFIALVLASIVSMILSERWYVCAVPLPPPLRPPLGPVIPLPSVSPGPNFQPTAKPGGPYTGIAGTAVTFQGSLRGPVRFPFILTWDFGDGATEYWAFPMFFPRP